MLLGTKAKFRGTKGHGCIAESDPNREERDESHNDKLRKLACGAKQLATTEFEVEFVVLCGHRGQVTPRRPEKPIAAR